METLIEKSFTTKLRQCCYERMVFIGINHFI